MAENGTFSIRNLTILQRAAFWLNCISHCLETLYVNYFKLLAKKSLHIRFQTVFDEYLLQKIKIPQMTVTCGISPLLDTQHIQLY